MNTPKTKAIIPNNSGQTFLEFILLIFSIMAISFLTINLINTRVAKRWKAAVELIVSPDPDNIIKLPLK